MLSIIPFLMELLSNEPQLHLFKSFNEKCPFTEQKYAPSPHQKVSNQTQFPLTKEKLHLHSVAPVLYCRCLFSWKNASGKLLRLPTATLLDDGLHAECCHRTASGMWILVVFPPELSPASPSRTRFSGGENFGSHRHQKNLFPSNKNKTKKETRNIARMIDDCHWRLISLNVFPHTHGHQWPVVVSIPHVNCIGNSITNERKNLRKGWPKSFSKHNRDHAAWDEVCSRMWQTRALV